VPLLAGAITLSLLAAAMVAHQADGGSIERYGAAAGGGLRWADMHGASVGDALLLDGDRAGVQVDVAPAQPGGLAAAQPAQRDQSPHRIERVVGDGGEERGQLLRGPDRDDRSLALLAPGGDPLIGPHLGVRAARTGQLDVAGRGCRSASPRGPRR
jgi:hypothetical protein